MCFCVCVPPNTNTYEGLQGVYLDVWVPRLFGYQSRIISAHRACGQAHSKGSGGCCYCSGCCYCWKGSLQNSVRVQNTQLAFCEGMKCGSEYIINEWWKTQLSIYSHIQLYLASVFLSPSLFFARFRCPPTTALVHRFYWLGFPYGTLPPSVTTEGNSFVATATIYRIRITEKERMRVRKKAARNLNRQTGPEVNWFLNALLLATDYRNLFPQAKRGRKGQRGRDFHFYLRWKHSRNICWNILEEGNVLFLPYKFHDIII